MGFSSVVWAADGMRLGFLHEGVAYVSDADGSLIELPRSASWTELAWFEREPVLMSSVDDILLHLEAVRVARPRCFRDGWFLSGETLCRLSPFEEAVTAEAFDVLDGRVVFAKGGAVSELGCGELLQVGEAVRSVRWLPDGSGVVVLTEAGLLRAGSLSRHGVSRFEPALDSLSVRFVSEDVLVELSLSDREEFALTPPELRVHDFAQPARSGEIFFSAYADDEMSRQAYRMLPQMGMHQLTTRPGAHDVFPSDDAELLALLYTDFDGKQSLFRMHGPLFEKVMSD